MSALSDDARHAILRRSSTLHERATALRLTVTSVGQLSAHLNESMLARWRGRLSRDGSDASLRRRLQWDALPADPECLLDSDAGDVPSNLRPEWFTAFESGLTESQHHCRQFTSNSHDPEVIPFGSVLAGFCDAAENAVIGSGEVELWDAQSAVLRRGVRRWLLSDISAVAQWALYVRFDAYRSTSCAAINSYGRFVRACADDLPSLFLEYAALPRLIGERLCNWIHNVRLLLRRLHDDTSELAQFLELKLPLTVSAIDCQLSDPHNGGNRVARIEFNQTRAVYYKPRTLGTKWFLTSIVNTYNRDAVGGTHRPIEIPKDLPRDGYFWEAPVDAEADTSTGGPAYFETLGALLCMTTVLNVVDCHYENVVPTSAGPVLVDYETAVSPRVRSPYEHARTQAAQLACDLVAHSPLRTGLLPSWHVDRLGRAKSIGGLGRPVFEQLTTFPRLVQINTDAMSVEEQAPTASDIPGDANRLSEGGLPENISEIIDALIDGFRNAWDPLISAIVLALENSATVKRLSESAVRIVYRATDYYTTLQAVSYFPDNLGSVLSYDLLFERLFRPFLSDASKPEEWAIVEMERRSLLIGDVPYFHTLCGEERRVFGRSVECALLRGSAIDELQLHIAECDTERLQHNIDLIRESMFCFGTTVHSPITSAPSATRSDQDARQIFTTSKQASPIASAVALGDGLLATAIKGSTDQSLSWLSRSTDPRSETASVGPIGVLGLSDGLPGLGLCFAALYRVTGEQKWRKASLGTISNTARILDDVPAESLVDVPNGGFCGLWSTIWALHASSLALGEQTYDCERVLSNIPDATFRLDSYFDLIGGNAGAATVLAEVAMATGSAVAKRLALLAGDELWTARHTILGAPAWISQSIGMALCGMAHGASGIALAFDRLARLSDDAVWSYRREQSLELERRTFDEGLQDWPVLLPSRRDQCVTRLLSAWCHGGPGIALARCAMTVMTECDLSVIRTGVATIPPKPVTDDSLCHGNAGLAAIEEYVGARVKDLALVERGRGRLQGLARRIQNSDSLLFSSSQAGQAFCPGLLSGVAGVALALSRTLDAALPSVLTLELSPMSRGGSWSPIRSGRGSLPRVDTVLRLP